jgi:hypothetical protein
LHRIVTPFQRDFLFLAPAFRLAANSIMRSVASSRRFSTTSSTRSQFGHQFTVHTDHAGIHNAHGHTGLNRVIQEP